MEPIIQSHLVRILAFMEGLSAHFYRCSPQSLFLSFRVEFG